MTFPLPPSDPRGIQPARAADHERRIHQQEGLALPTPRTYRKRSIGSVGSYTTTPLTLLTLDIFLRPGEALGVFFSLGLRSNAANTGTYVYVDAMGPFPTLDLISQLPVPVHATNFSTLDSKKAGSDDGPGFQWKHAYRDGSNNFVDITEGTAFTLTFKAVRSAGTGTLTAADPQAWAMIV